jgi:hypothetical protein
VGEGKFSVFVCWCSFKSPAAGPLLSKPVLVRETSNIADIVHRL